MRSLREITVGTSNAKTVAPEAVRTRVSLARWQASVSPQQQRRSSRTNLTDVILSASSADSLNRCACSLSPPVTDTPAAAPYDPVRWFTAHVRRQRKRPRRLRQSRALAIAAAIFTRRLSRREPPWTAAISGGAARLTTARRPLAPSPTRNNAEMPVPASRLEYLQSRFVYDDFSKAPLKNKNKTGGATCR